MSTPRHERCLAGRHRSRQAFCQGLTLAVAALLSLPALSEEQSVTELSLDDLANAEILSATKKPQALIDTSAAVFVINRETIRQSGATSIPELLRIVPGVNVAQIDASKWAVSIRGFNNRFSKNLLVMIDGRAVYDHTLSGVFWEHLAVPLAEIERIEVVRGPGGAVWGANAVNGIINIITRRATDTLGGLASGGSGNFYDGFGTLRYGRTLGDGLYARAYLSALAHDSFDDPTGGSNHDGWQRHSAGVRLDWLLGPHDNLTVQADSFDGEFDQHGVQTLLVDPYLVDIDETAHGHGSSVQTRWTHDSGEHGEWQLQCYYDNNHHSEALYGLSNHTLDVELQHHWPVHPQHQLSWGAGYRRIENEVAGLSFPGIEAELDWQNRTVFLSDEMALGEQFALIVGAKWEDSELTDDHLLPTLRASWQPIDSWSFWAAYGEAARTPNRIEFNVEWLLAVVPPNRPPNNLPVPAALFILGNPDLMQESLQAAELGARWLASATLSLDLALFRHDYQDIVMFQALTPRFDPELGLLRLDFEQQNLADADAHGAELLLHWLPSSRWGNTLSYSYLDVTVTAPAAQTSTARNSEGSAARHQLALHSRLALADDWHANLGVYWRDRLHNSSRTLAARTDLEASLGWQYSDQLQLRLTGRNLTGNDEPAHFDSKSAELGRSVNLAFRYEF